MAFRYGAIYFGAEESYGYLYGSYVEDKDAMIAAVLISEAALQQKYEGVRYEMLC